MNNFKLDYPIYFKCGAGGSRISNKILAKLKASKDVFKLTKMHTPLHLKMYKDEPLETVIRFKDKEQGGKLDFLLNEIVAVIPELFPANYSFRIYKRCHGLPYNYKLEFTLETPYNNEVGFVAVYSKINEVSKNSRKDLLAKYDIQIEG